MLGVYPVFHRFILCSGLAAFVNLAVGYVLYGVMGFDQGLHFAGAVAAAFVAGMGVSFLLNRRFTYAASGRDMRDELRDFFGVSIVGAALTAGIAHALDSWAGGAMAALAAQMPRQVLPETMAHIGAVGVTAFYSFVAHKLVSFRPAAPLRDLSPFRLER